MTSTAAPPTCHYAVLGVDQNATASTIKKAHRKLALQYHPDKNTDDTAEQQFLAVQQAYECLSDPVERQWYDEHREAILKGWSAASNSSDIIDMVFDVEPFMYAGCFRGYNEDTEDGFYAVYGRVFGAVQEGEQQQAQEFDPDQDDTTLSFGTADTAWEQVAAFYQTWESFSSNLNFAWVDPYDITTAENRRVRRAMEEENRKARRTAKRARNEEILALVRFVKRRDPRVKARRQEQEEKKRKEEVQRQKEAGRRKKETLQAREQWRQEAEEAMAVAEEEDRVAGRVRLADLDDDYDYGGKKGKKGRKKNKGAKKVTEEGEESESDEGATAPGTDEKEGEAGGAIEVDADAHERADEAKQVEDGSVGTPTDVISADESGADSEESEEPDIWRCDCCRKDFKSEGQMENHMKSKKHRQVWKKYQATLEKLERDLMNEVLDEKTD